MEIECLAIHADGDIFVGIEDSGFFRSIDHGDSWEMVTLPDGFASSLAVDSQGYLFAGGIDVQRSTDGGATWTQTSLREDIISLAIGPDGDIFAGTEVDGVYRSTDDGATWVPTGLEEAFSQLAFNANGDIFAGRFEGVYRSADHGATWALTGLEQKSIGCLIIDVAGNLFAGSWYGGVYRSTDHGVTWALTGLENAILFSLAIDADGNLFAGCATGPRTLGVYRSTDGGATWIQVLGDVRNPWGFSSEMQVGLTPLLVDARGNVFAGMVGSGVFLSTDSGATWTPINSGLTNPMVLSLAAGPRGDIFAGTVGSGVFRTSAAGR